MVELRKVRGDAMEFSDWYRRFEERCASIILAPGGSGHGGDGITKSLSAAALEAKTSENLPLLPERAV